MKEKLMPEQLKRLESSLKSAGLNTSSDVENLTFALFRTAKPKGLALVGVAQGNIPVQRLTLNMKKKKIKALKYREALIYPLSGSGMSFCMLDDATMLFGDQGAVKQALDARDGTTRNLNNNSEITDQLASIQDEPIWSVLDAVGTQTMMRSALGDAAGLADYETVKKRLLGSHYTMDFFSGVKFVLDVKSSDAFSAVDAVVAGAGGRDVQALSASPAEKSALDSLTVDSSGSDVLLKFATDDKKFVSLVNSPMFQAFSR